MSSTPDAPSIDRRRFLRSTALGAGALLAGGALSLVEGCGGSGTGASAAGGAALGAGSGAGAAGGSGGGLPPQSLVNAATGSASGAPLVRRVPSSIMSALRAELDVDLHVISGRLPTDLAGHAFTIAPLPEGGGNYAFSGDGIVYRLDFGAARVGLRSRIMKTPCWYADVATRGTYAAFRNQNLGPARISQDLGVRNQVNTAFLPLGTDRLLVTFDAGRPFEIDPVSLEIATAVGWNHEWKTGMQFPAAIAGAVMGDVFPMVQTSAHPCWDAHTGQMFALNYGGNQGIRFLGNMLFSEVFTDVIRWDGAGALQKWRLLDERGNRVKIEMSAHQMQVTESYVIVMDCAFNMEAEKVFGADRMTAQKPDTVIWLVRRADLDRTPQGGHVLARKVVIPREGVHFLADYANPGERITLQVCHNCAADPSEWLLAADREAVSGAAVRADLLGMIPAPCDIGFVGHHEIDGASATWDAGRSRYVKDDGFTWGAAFYTLEGLAQPARVEDVYWTSTGFFPDLLSRRILDAYRTYAHREVPVARLPTADGRPTTLFRMSRAQGSTIVDGWRFPAGYMGLSPTFVPRAGAAAGATRDGYVVISVISDDRSWSQSSGDEFWIFDATDLARGPICRLGHPQLDLPFTLHTTWLPEVRPRTAAYKVDVRQDHQAAVGKLNAGLRGVFDTQVFPYF